MLIGNVKNLWCIKMKYNNNRDCNYFEMTLLRLLFVIARVRVGHSEEEFRFMRSIEKQLFKAFSDED